MNLEFTFEESPVEAFLATLIPDSTVSAGHLLPLLEGAGEDALEDAFRDLEQRHITLEVRDLPSAEQSDEMAVRLRQEAQWVKNGTLLTAPEENDPLGLYLQELAAIPAAGDIQVLAMELLAGDQQVAERLVNLQLHRVVELASEMTDRGVLLLDLIQEGSLGLWQGILAYTGGDLESHCQWWIRQYLARAVTVQAVAGGVGQKLRQGMRDYMDVDNRLLTELGRNPTLEEMAEAMHITPEDAAVYEDMLRISQARQQTQQARQMAEPTPDDEQAVEDTAYFQSRQRILELLSALSEQEAQLLTLRYGLEGGLPLKPEQVGARMGLTADEVVAMEAAALAKLRQS